MKLTPTAPWLKLLILLAEIRLKRLYFFKNQSSHGEPDRPVIEEHINQLESLIAETKAETTGIPIGQRGPDPIDDSETPSSDPSNPQIQFTIGGTIPDEITVKMCPICDRVPVMMTTDGLMRLVCKMHLGTFKGPELNNTFDSSKGWNAVVDAWIGGFATGSEK